MFGLTTQHSAPVAQRIDVTFSTDLPKNSNIHVDKEVTLQFGLVCHPGALWDRVSLKGHLLSAECLGLKRPLFLPITTCMVMSKKNCQQDGTPPHHHHHDVRSYIDDNLPGWWTGEQPYVCLILLDMPFTCEVIWREKPETLQEPRHETEQSSTAIPARLGCLGDERWPLSSSLLSAAPRTWRWSF